jgi:hypothetical protein
VLADFVRFMNGLPSLPVFLVIVVFVEPLLVLAHELGHAAAAVSRLPGRVVVRVGGVRPLLTLNAGRVSLRLHPLVLPWRFSGQCAYEGGSQSRGDAIVIALAGPATSLGCGLAALLASGAVGNASPLHSILQVATFLGFGTCVLCLVPLTLRDSTGRTMRTDGAQVAAALRA